MAEQTAGTGPDHPAPPAAAAAPPEPLAHTRTRPWQWAAVAAALGGVVALALTLAPAEAAPVADGPHAVPAAGAPDPARAALPLHCDGLPVDVTQRFSADLTGNGTVATVAAAHCLAGNGTPPDGLYLLEAGPDGRPRIAGTLITPQQDLTVRSVTFRSDGSIQAAVDGYSSPDVPSCCPDLHETYTWTPHADGWTRTVSVPLLQT
ncbi:hypothetical protein [Streptacidiphilus albus]|uniref:hypothetical protein n=1 Tax=Streptacidiphilus albus TaxID=105425 RepID=UPI0005A82109|nr:hypothetical protein [Streptacidiphilus albus]